MCLCRLYRFNVHINLIFGILFSLRLWKMERHGVVVALGYILEVTCIYSYLPLILSIFMIMRYTDS